MISSMGKSREMKLSILIVGTHAKNPLSHEEVESHFQGELAKEDGPLEDVNSFCQLERAALTEALRVGIPRACCLFGLWLC